MTVSTEENADIREESILKMAENHCPILEMTVSEDFSGGDFP